MIGIDSVEIGRFVHWHSYGAKLLKIFTQVEIDYCLKYKSLSAQRFASRFAAKEAVYKAISNKFYINCTFVSFCKFIEIIKDKNNVPKIKIDFAKLDCPKFDIEISITHTKDMATAVALVIH